METAVKHRPRPQSHEFRPNPVPEVGLSQKGLTPAPHCVFYQGKEARAPVRRHAQRLVRRTSTKSEASRRVQGPKQRRVLRKEEGGKHTGWRIEGANNLAVCK